MHDRIIGDNIIQGLFELLKEVSPVLLDQDTILSLETDSVVIAYSLAEDVDLTLPDASICDGHSLYFNKVAIGSNTVLIKAPVINGGSTQFRISANGSFTRVISRGADGWFTSVNNSFLYAKTAGQVNQLTTTLYAPFKSFDSDVHSSDSSIVVDTANAYIDIQSTRAGTYRCSAIIDFEFNNNESVTFQLKWDGVAIGDEVTIAGLGAGTTVRAVVNAAKYITMANKFVTLEAKSTVDGTVLVIDSEMLVERVG